MGIDENVRELRMLIIFLGLGKNGPGKNGPGKNSPGKNGPGDYWISSRIGKNGPFI